MDDGKHEWVSLWAKSKKKKKIKQNPFNHFWIITSSSRFVEIILKMCIAGNSVFIG